MKGVKGFQKGNQISKGRIMTEEHKRRISLSNKGRNTKEKVSRECERCGKNYISSGKRFCSRLCSARSRVTSWSKGKHFSEEHRKKLSGENSHLWKGGITPERNKVRNSLEYKLWRKAIFERDNYICQKYKTLGGTLRAHHIHNFSDNPELRLAIDNGITLSDRAHKEFHRIYGIKNNTKEQLNEYIND